MKKKKRTAIIKITGLVLLAGLMIRGCDKDNPVIIFVHGGPCCSEIPYVRKYQKGDIYF